MMINIRITKRTKTSEILPMLNEDSFNRLLEAVPEHPLKNSVFSMKIRQFAEILENETEFITLLLKQKRALVAFGMVKKYKAEVESLAKFLKMYDYQQTNEEKQASHGIVYPSMAQRMLTDCVRFFNLKSFDEAEEKTVSDWLTVFQTDAATALYQRKLHEAFEKKMKKKK